MRVSIEDILHSGRYTLFKKIDVEEDNILIITCDSFLLETSPEVVTETRNPLEQYPKYQS